VFDRRRLPIIAAVVSIAMPLAAKPPPPPAKDVKPAPSASPTPPPAPSSPEETEARRHFETGLKLYKEKLFEAALVEFEQSYKIIPRPSALRNVAQCHRDLKRFAEAYVVFDRLLTTHGPQLSAPELAAVKKALKDLESVTGTIAFDVNETAALVIIDGREVGRTPLGAPVRVDVGPHSLRVTKAGYETFEQTVKVLAMQSLPVDAKLIKDIKTGKVTIKEKGSKKVTVVVDDVERGPAPWTGELSPGAHIIELRGEGLISTRKTIEVTAKTETEHSLEATALRGRLRVETFGKKGKIFVDGKFVADGIWEGELPPGAHRIKVVAEGYQAHERLVAVEHGQTVVEAVTLVAVPIEVKPPPPPPPAAPAIDPYRGLYGRFALFGAFSMTGAGEEARPVCKEDRKCTSFDSSSPMGAGAALHVGHSWGIIGAEFVGAFLFDFHQMKRTYAVVPSPTQLPSEPAGAMARSETWDYYAFAGFAGLGGRVTSKDDAVRFTLGVAFGGVYRGANVKRSTLDDGWKPPAATYFAPAIMADAGLLLGSTPGFKMSIGAAAWIDFPGSDVESEAAPEGSRPVSATYGTSTVGARLESPTQLLRSGTQVYIGPTLGFQFGR